MADEDLKLPIDSRKRKRMISNRESARRSRMKKQQHLKELTKQIAQLQAENAKIATQIEFYAERFVKVDGDNTVLRTRVAELTERLRSLNSILEFVEDFSGMEMDIPEIPDPLLRPWQLPCPSSLQPIMASAHMFQF